MNEIWKDIPWTNGHYQASNMGSIRSLDRVVERIRNGKSHNLPKKGMSLKPEKEGWGYLQVSLYGKYKKVHRLVADAFMPMPCPGLVINHKNGIKTDNRIENLEWCTQSQNIRHAFASGLNKGSQTGKSGHLHHGSTQVISIKQTSIIEHGSIRECSKYFSVHPKTIFNYLQSGNEFRGNTFYRI